ncbi:hypothetical protein PHPALM_1348 [Phytophthora palmivora]|uniref:Uncharacterized protein n=1 Tax=Phytophthora palmivora TaxID=4796 RepID=A0A2P4YSI5_9STRA|nr:hypothetical protein PHPALM_1348 [Phytophthora palmivora]
MIFTKTPTRTSKKSSPKKKPKRRFSKVQKQKLERVLVEFQSGNFLPGLFIERPCTKSLLEYLCSGITAYLPSRRVLGGRIARDHAVHCREVQDVAKDATAAVKTLNSSSAKWLVRARALMEECYKKALALFTLCETRWSSMQSCFASLLRVRTSLEMFASKYLNYKDFPGPLKVFSDPTFWRKLAEAEQIIAPLSEAPYRLQRDENTLADVVVSFRYFFGGSRRLIRIIKEG